MRKNIFVFICAVLAVLIGCNSSKSRSDTVVVAIGANPATFDPRVATDAFSDKISQLIFDGLFDRDVNMEVVPSLAETYEQISPTEYLIHLKKGVKFHNGEELTVKDVMYTFRSMIDGEIASPFKSDFSKIAEMSALDDYTLNIKLKEPYAPFLTLLIRGIVPESMARTLGKDFGTQPVGTGPFIMDKFISEKKVMLKKNPDYWKGAPKIEKIEFEIVPDDNVRVLKIMKGDVDFALNEVPPMLVKKVSQARGIAVDEGVSIVSTYLGFNLRDSILKNKLVRQAIAHAIDRDEIINHRWEGLAVKANSIMSPDNWSYSNDLGDIKFDPELAKELLDKAGYKDPDGDGPKPRFKITYKTSTTKSRVDIARMIAHQLAKVGISVEVLPYEWGTFFDDVKKGNFQIYSLSWVGVTEPDIFYYVCHSNSAPPNGLNRGHYKNSKVDELVETGRRTMDREVRKQMYSEVQKILLEDLPYVPLWYEKNVAVRRKDVKGFELWPNASFKPLVKVYK